MTSAEMLELVVNLHYVEAIGQQEMFQLVGDSIRQDTLLEVSNAVFERLGPPTHPGRAYLTDARN